MERRGEQGGIKDSVEGKENNKEAKQKEGQKKN